MSNDTTTRPVRIFMSYSHTDTEYKKKLWRHLNRFLGGKGILWGDQLIEAGQGWKEEIWIQLHRADLILFLMSSDSIDSDFIWNVELAKTYARYDAGEVSFIPIYLRDCNWQAIKDLARFQVIPRDNKPIVHNTYWSSADEPYKKVADEVIEKVEIIWQRINSESIEHLRPMRFAGIAKLLKENQHFFIMGKIEVHTVSGRPEDVLYFIGMANHLRDISLRIQRAEKNGSAWVQHTLADIEFYRDICEQLETVFSCSDYVWGKLKTIHVKAKSRVELVEKNIANYIGVGAGRMDYYHSTFALPASFSLDEYQELLRGLAEESISAQ